MEPNGIHYDTKEDAYYVSQKPELTRLIDLNKDGVCDRYECVTDALVSLENITNTISDRLLDSGKKICVFKLSRLWRVYSSLMENLLGKVANMSYNAPWRGCVPV